MSFRKHLATGLMALAICVAASPAVYADTTLNMQANSVAGDAADYSGYQIKWYTTSADGTRTENTTILTDASGACTLTIPDEALGLGYEIYTSDGTLVSDFKQILSGSPQFWDNTKPIWFDLAPKASQMPTGLTIVDNDDSVTTLDLSSFGISGSTPQGNTSNSDSNTASDNTQSTTQITEYAGKVRVVSDVNIDLLRNQGITFYAMQGGAQNRVDVAVLPAEYSDFALPSSGTFTFSISNSAVSAWSSVEIANTGDNMAEIKVVPKCLLYVTNGGKEVQAKVLNSGYKHPDKITLGVRNGEEYTIVDMTTNKAYRFVVPSNVTECALDFSTMDGVPVNELAQQDATLTNTGDFDNPYNVPLTDERTFGDEVSRIAANVLFSAQDVSAIARWSDKYVNLGFSILGAVLIAITIFAVYLIGNIEKTHASLRGFMGMPTVTAKPSLFKVMKQKLFKRKAKSKYNGVLSGDGSMPMVLWSNDDTGTEEAPDDTENDDNGEE